jgi:hypothetical protein
MSEKAMRILLLILSLVAAIPAAAQSPAPPVPTPEQRPKHLVVLNKHGPNFGKLPQMRAEALAHRQIYLDLTAAGDILVSGSLQGTPSMGLTVFRQDVDEARIRKLLADDAIIKAGVLELEFRYWSIQMGALEPPAPAAK